MNILVTAGNTQVLIDKVRCLTNIFTGKTGASIVREAIARGHAVTLLTSHPETADPGWQVIPYRTFDDLQRSMASWIMTGRFDAMVHCAAVSDYLAGGVYSPAAGTNFDVGSGRWTGSPTPEMIDRAAGKIKSDEEELWLRLVRAPKLIDYVREQWDFRGVLVKFKLEVGKTEQELIDIAERSRCQSSADIMAANTLEGSSAWAMIGPVAGQYQKVTRAELPRRLIELIEIRHGERSHG